MKSCLKSLSALIAAVVMFSCSQAGKHQALEDIAAESARYIIYGELMPFEKELGDRLFREHSIKLSREEDCTVNQAYVSFVEGYNKEIQKHFGLDIEAVLSEYWKEISDSLVQKSDASKETSNLNKAEPDTFKCNIKVLLNVSQNKDSLEAETLNQFLMTFGAECNTNVEFSEWSNELLFDVIQRYPVRIVQILTENQELEEDVILYELRNPVHDGIDIEQTIRIVKKALPKNSMMGKIIDALKTAELKYHN